MGNMMINQLIWGCGFVLNMLGNASKSHRVIIYLIILQIKIGPCVQTHPNLIKSLL